MAKQIEKTVLFLCTANYYRSQFAEALFNSVAGKMGLLWRASPRRLALERGVNNVGPMAEAGRRVKVFQIDPGTQERLGLLATATVGEGGWVALPEPIIMRAGEAFVAVPEVEKEGA